MDSRGEIIIGISSYTIILDFKKLILIWIHPYLFRSRYAFGSSRRRSHNARFREIVRNAALRGSFSLILCYMIVLVQKSCSLSALDHARNSLLLPADWKNHSRCRLLSSASDASTSIRKSLILDQIRCAFLTIRLLDSWAVMIYDSLIQYQIATGIIRRLLCERILPIYNEAWACF